MPKLFANMDKEFAKSKKMMKEEMGKADKGFMKTKKAIFSTKKRAKRKGTK